MQEKHTAERTMPPMNVLVTGGGTRAPIDDVRTITNISTGRFSAAISESCLAHGARVWHVHAPSAQVPLLRSAQIDLDCADLATEFDRLKSLRWQWLLTRDRLHLVPLETGTVADYAGTLRRLLSTERIDVAFLAMAVSDYEPEQVAGKLSSSASELVIRCRPTPKVIRLVREWAPDLFLVGFKLLSGAATAELIRQAETSARASQANLTVANDLQTVLAGAHAIHLVRSGQAPETLGPGPDLADRLVQRVFTLAADHH